MGILYIIATPIGNLDDITYRAIDTFKKVDYVLCEDTRVTGKLLKKYNIDNRMISFNEHNENTKSIQVLRDLESNINIALVSDAGTPLVSDPGYKLVRNAIDKGIRVQSIPGASSVITAMTLSGLPPDKFLFIGYLSKSEIKRNKILEGIKENNKNIKSTTIIFESPYRIVKTLESIYKVFGDKNIAICRELTKMFEEVRREKISASISHYSKTKPKGEFILLF